MDVPVQDGADGHVLISSSKSVKITTSCWITIYRRMQESTPKGKTNPCPKTKKKLQPDGRRGTIMIESNPIPWEGDPQSGKGSPAWGLDKGTGNPQGIWPWRPERFDYKTSTALGKLENPVMKDTSKTLCAPRLRGKEQRLHRKLSQNYLLVLEGPLWSHGVAGTHHKDRGTGSSCLGRLPLV